MNIKTKSKLKLEYELDKKDRNIDFKIRKDKIINKIPSYNYFDNFYDDFKILSIIEEVTKSSLDRINNIATENKKIVKQIENEILNKQIFYSSDKKVHNLTNKIEEIKFQSTVTNSNLFRDNQSGKEIENKNFNNIINKNPVEFTNENKMVNNNLINNNKGKIPKNFYYQWEILNQMRSKIDSPIDSIIKILNDSKEESRSKFKFQLLIYLILSQRSKNTSNLEAIKKLCNYGFSLDKMLNLSNEEIDNLIGSVGLHQSKTKYIKQLCLKIQHTYKGDPPETFNELIELPGIGNRMAEVYLNQVAPVPRGISVSSHIHRVFNRLEWITTESYEQTKEAIEDFLPKEMWSKLNFIVDGYAQTICRIDPHCQNCLLQKSCGFKLKNKIVEEKLQRKKKKKCNKSKEIQLAINTTNCNNIIFKNEPKLLPHEEIDEISGEESNTEADSNLKVIKKSKTLNIFKTNRIKNIDKISNNDLNNLKYNSDLDTDLIFYFKPKFNK